MSEPNPYITSHGKAAYRLYACIQCGTVSIKQGIGCVICGGPVVGEHKPEIEYLLIEDVVSIIPDDDIADTPFPMPPAIAMIEKDPPPTFGEIMRFVFFDKPNVPWWRDALVVLALLGVLGCVLFMAYQGTQTGIPYR